MREIKFRVWDNYNSKMIELGGLEEICTNPDLDFANYDVMQFTGVKDKNGVDVYEGDVYVVYDSDIDDFGEEKLTQSIRTVKYSTGVMSIGFQFMTHYSNIEVIGNIHENK